MRLEVSSAAGTLEGGLKRLLLPMAIERLATKSADKRASGEQSPVIDEPREYD